MSIRTKRLGEVIRQDLSSIIGREYQPEGTFITVTKVSLTEDLSIARVYLSVFAPGRDEIPIFEKLDESVQEIRYKLAGKIRNQVRKIPELQFFVDDTAEYVDKIESLFQKVREQPKAPGPDEGEEG